MLSNVSNVTTLIDNFTSHAEQCEQCDLSMQHLLFLSLALVILSLSSKTCLIVNFSLFHYSSYSYRFFQHLPLLHFFFFHFGKNQKKKKNGTVHNLNCSWHLFSSIPLSILCPSKTKISLKKPLQGQVLHILLI